MGSVIFARSCHGYAVNETQKPEAIVAPLLQYSVPEGGLGAWIADGNGLDALKQQITGGPSARAA
jgi:site-specific DNA-methyltransferase (adenine-specific)